jgi:NADPH:quinone reductase-like Zn-dependent oxidoreductase
MKALVIDQYGGPEVMRIADLPVPAPGLGDVLVRMETSNVNPIDWKIREGYLGKMFPVQFPRILGRDGAGIVTALGEGVEGFAVGDPVFGMGVPTRNGPHSEYALFPAASLAKRPPGLSAEQAGVAVVAGLSAYIPIWESPDVKKGARVLIHAASGGVGHIAVQMALLKGAHVIAVTSTEHLDFVKSLGPHQVIDRRTQDFVQAAGPCDVVFDTVGGETHTRSYDALKPGGLLAFLNTGPVTPQVRDGIRALQPQVNVTPERLPGWAELLVSGKVKVEIRHRFTLETAVEAYRLSQSASVAGKILITIG